MPDEITQLIISAATRMGIEAERIYPQLIMFFWWKSLATLIMTPLLMIIMPIVFMAKVGIPQFRTAWNMSVADRWKGFPVEVICWALACAVIAVFVGFCFVDFMYRAPILIATVAYPEIGFFWHIIEKATTIKK